MSNFRLWLRDLWRWLVDFAEALWRSVTGADEYFLLVSLLLGAFAVFVFGLLKQLFVCRPVLSSQWEWTKRWSREREDRIDRYFSGTLRRLVDWMERIYARGGAALGDESEMLGAYDELMKDGRWYLQLHRAKLRAVINCLQDEQVNGGKGKRRSTDAAVEALGKAVGRIDAYETNLERAEVAAQRLRGLLEEWRTADTPSDPADLMTSVALLKQRTEELSRLKDAEKPFQDEDLRELLPRELLPILDDIFAFEREGNMAGAIPAKLERYHQQASGALIPWLASVSRSLEESPDDSNAETVPAQSPDLSASVSTRITTPLTITPTTKSIRPSAIVQSPETNPPPLPSQSERSTGAVSGIMLPPTAPLITPPKPPKERTNSNPVTGYISSESRPSLLFSGCDPSKFVMPEGLVRVEPIVGNPRQQRWLDWVQWIAITRGDTGARVFAPAEATLFDSQECASSDLRTGFNASNELFYGAFHLGIFHDQLPMDVETRFTFGGWGFGHRSSQQTTVSGHEPVQATCWEGLQIASDIMIDIRVYESLPDLAPEDRVLAESAS